MGLLPLHLVQPGPQHPHGLFPVLNLAALVLASHHQPGGNVGNAHRRIGSVYVLSTRPGGPVGIDAQIRGSDVHLHVLRLRQYGYRSCLLYT